MNGLIKQQVAFPLHAWDRHVCCLDAGGILRGMVSDYWSSHNFAYTLFQNSLTAGVTAIITFDTILFSLCLQ